MLCPRQFWKVAQVDYRQRLHLTLQTVERWRPGTSLAKGRPARLSPKHLPEVGEFPTTAKTFSARANDHESFDRAVKFSSVSMPRDLTEVPRFLLNGKGLRPKRLPPFRSADRPGELLRLEA
jgi:hypothetical protein